jgi:hypothetical protein
LLAFFGLSRKVIPGFDPQTCQWRLHDTDIGEGSEPPGLVSFSDNGDIPLHLDSNSESQHSPGYNFEEASTDEPQPFEGDAVNTWVTAQTWDAGHLVGNGSGVEEQLSFPASDGPTTRSHVGSFYPLGQPVTADIPVNSQFLPNNPISPLETLQSATPSNSFIANGCRGCGKAFSKPGIQNRHFRYDCPRGLREKFSCRQHGCAKEFTGKKYRDEHEVKYCMFGAARVL